MTPWISDIAVQAWLGADKIDLTAASSLAMLATGAVMSVIERDLALVVGVTAVHDSNGTDFILLDHWPVRSIAAVNFNGTQVQAAGYNQPGWRLDPFNPRKLCFTGMGRLARGVMNVTVSGLTAGYDVSAPPGDPLALPAHVVQALGLTAAALFYAQAADPNLMAENTAGVFSGTFAPSGVGSVPPGARTLLLPEMRVAC